MVIVRRASYGLSTIFEGASARAGPNRAAAGGDSVGGEAAGVDLHAIYGAGKVGGAASVEGEEAEAEAEDDDRTLWVDVDNHGER